MKLGIKNVEEKKQCSFDILAKKNEETKKFFFLKLKITHIDTHYM